MFFSPTTQKTDSQTEVCTKPQILCTITLLLVGSGVDLPERSCGCSKDAVAVWAAGQSEVEPVAVAVEMDMEAGYGWTGRLQVEDIHQG